MTRAGVSGRRRPPDTGRSAVASWVASSVEDLNPGAFAFVMATGIISTALTGDGAATASAVLAVIAAAGYVLLWAASVWRAAWRPRRFLGDLAGPRGFSFLTLVAASEVLASRALAARLHGVAVALIAVGAAGWLLLGYGVPLLLIHSGGPLSLRQVNGTWFIWAVGTQSVAVATASLAQHIDGTALGALASACWAVGLLQYLLIAALTLARLLLEPLTPAELVPPYWVFMGAAAISVLAGAKLLELPPGDELLPHEVVLGLSTLLWSFCTWLIPLLLALGVWRHVLRRQPLRYETSLWSLVFPVGMYGVATGELGRVAGWDWMTTIGTTEAWAALAVWAAAFTAMLATAARAVYVNDPNDVEDANRP
ncbi:tellurite resistance/C4-dicarboxylate transporter family protein [Streptomyces bungoensis]|uniref:tellurite resistance/C4-dicarboxylate transporter family protein n=1 Tax=Streptomyces bungoensis TaxID=285568 RepID=UPI0036A0F6A7